MPPTCPASDATVGRSARRQRAIRAAAQHLAHAQKCAGARFTRMHAFPLFQRDVHRGPRPRGRLRAQEAAKHTSPLTGPRRCSSLSNAARTLAILVPLAAQADVALAMSVQSARLPRLVVQILPRRLGEAVFSESARC